MSSQTSTISSSGELKRLSTPKLSPSSLGGISRPNLSRSNLSAASSHSFGGTGSGQLNAGQYNLTDIYEFAAVIGGELEKIINQHGADILKDLMPKVIQVLEVLEHLTIRNEKENDELSELRFRCSCLEVEKAQRSNERERFEKEVEEIEEKWKQETLKLIAMVNKLKEENKRLNESIDHTTTFKQNEHLSKCKMRVFVML